MNKNKTLFNKNHILIKRVDKDPYLQGGATVYIHTTGNGRVKTSNEYEMHKVRKISKIAPFYYETEEKRPKSSLNNADRKDITKKIITISSKHYTYEISYYTVYGDNHIGIETRPWEICSGDGAFEEHFIKDLEKVIKEIFIDVNIDKLLYDIRYRYDYNLGNIQYNGQKLRIEIMNDLFADKDGYKQQTNESKILAHGFDLKESFRKRKES